MTSKKEKGLSCATIKKLEAEMKAIELLRNFIHRSLKTVNELDRIAAQLEFIRSNVASEGASDCERAYGEWLVLGGVIDDVRALYDELVSAQSSEEVAAVRFSKSYSKRFQ